MMSLQRVILAQFVIIMVMFAFNIGLILAVVHVQRAQNLNHQYTNQTLTNIEKQMTCLGTFFVQPGAVRAQGSILGIKACQPLIPK